MSRPRLSLLLLPALLMILAGSNQQCVPVDDSITAPALNAGLAAAGGVSACVQVCNDIAQEQRDEEKILYKADLDACGDDYECMELAEAEHEARMEEIALEMQYCKALCHEQGTGSGGQ